VQITDKNGKTTIARISEPEGDDVYVRVEGNPSIYKVSKQMYEDYNFKASDIVQ
jgi:hypothetical protein